MDTDVLFLVRTRCCWRADTASRDGIERSQGGARVVGRRNHHILERILLDLAGSVGTTLAELCEVGIGSIATIGGIILRIVVVLLPGGIVAHYAVGHEDEGYVEIASNVGLDNGRGRDLGLISIPDT